MKNNFEIEQDSSAVNQYRAADALYETFAKPPQISKTRPLWFWNKPLEELTELEIREVVRESYLQSGYNGFGIVPFWLKGYLSDKYFALYEAALDEGSKYGMQFSLYDEDGFPSYNAGGLFGEKFPELTVKRIDKIEKQAVFGERVELLLPQGILLGAVAMNMDTLERINISDKVSGTDTESGGRLTFTPDGSGEWRIMTFMCVQDGRNGMDYLDPEAVASFIDLTHGEYYRRFQKYFENGTITSAFYDEPTFRPWEGTTPYGAEGARMWTPKYNQAYEEIYGESPVLNYPALWYDIGQETTQARNKLMHVRTELFAVNYIGQVQKWCTEHGISLMGHMLLEEWVNPVGLHGDLMKVFKHQDIPGVDVIFYYGYTQEAFKIISSAAKCWDKGLVMSESFGATEDADFSIDMMYKSTMDQYAKGINMIIPHAVWTGPANFPQNLAWNNPAHGIGESLSKYNDYAGRLNTLLQYGRHVTDIAMLYPIHYLEADFDFVGDAQTWIDGPADADYLRLSEYLSLTVRRDFTYLHPEIIDDKCEVKENVLKLHNTYDFGEYKVFVMPGAKVISLSNLQKIKAFYDAGGKVIATTQLPYQATAVNENSKVVCLVEEMFGVSPKSGSAVGAMGRVGDWFQKVNPAGGCAYFIPDNFELKMQEVLDHAQPVYDVSFSGQVKVDGGNLSYIHKVKDGRHIYFIANSSDKPIETTLRLRGELKSPRLWDPHTGKQMQITFDLIQVNGQKVTEVKIRLGKIKSVFILEEQYGFISI